MLQKSRPRCRQLVWTRYQPVVWRPRRMESHLNAFRPPAFRLCISSNAWKLRVRIFPIIGTCTPLISQTRELHRTEPPRSCSTTKHTEHTKGLRVGDRFVSFVFFVGAILDCSKPSGFSRRAAENERWAGPRTTKRHRGAAVHSQTRRLRATPRAAKSTFHLFETQRESLRLQFNRSRHPRPGSKTTPAIISKAWKLRPRIFPMIGSCSLTISSRCGRSPASSCLQRCSASGA